MSNYRDGTLIRRLHDRKVFPVQVGITPEGKPGTLGFIWDQGKSYLVGVHGHLAAAYELVIQ